MDYRKVISESWKYTQQNKKLIIWCGFVPSLATTTVSIAYLIYQFFAFKNSYLFNDQDHSVLADVITAVWLFVKSNVSLTAPLVIIGVIAVIFYFLFPTLAQAAAYQTIARNINGQKAGVGTGFRHGIMSFLKLFEYHLLIKTFAFFSIMIEMSFVLRNLGPVIFKFLLPIFLLFIIVSFVLTLLFTYADLYLVIDDKNVFESMKLSGKMVIMNWRHTFLITLLMIMIGLRIIIQAVMVFLIPAIVVVLSGYVATIALPIGLKLVAGVIGFICLIIAAYLNGIVDIFSYTVWTRTFLEVTGEPETTARDKLEFKDEIGEQQPAHSVHRNLES